jgi:hypothetical protein
MIYTHIKGKGQFPTATTGTTFNASDGHLWRYPIPFGEEVKWRQGPRLRACWRRRSESLKIKVAKKETQMGALKDNDLNSLILFYLIKETAQLPDHIPVHQVHGWMVNDHKTNTLLYGGYGYSDNARNSCSFLCAVYQIASTVPYQVQPDLFSPEDAVPVREKTPQLLTKGYDTSYYSTFP